MPGADEQHRQARQSDQRIGDDVQRQRIDEQQQQAADGDEQDFAEQQFVQRMRAERSKEAVGKHQPARCGEQQGEVGTRCLHRVPVR
ncbi:hypothetical protein D9M71_765510 [compost metagenome]